VGIGDTTPDYLLDVAGTLGLDSTLTLTGSAANIAIGSNWITGDGTDGEGITIDSNGNVGVGSGGASTIKLEVTQSGAGLADMFYLFGNSTGCATQPRRVFAAGRIDEG
jgi:hypothetical protein